MERVPEKITVRLDFTTREMLAHYIARKRNGEVSMVVRRALRRFLEGEAAEYALACEEAENRMRGIAKETKASKEKAVQS